MENAGIMRESGWDVRTLVGTGIAGDRDGSKAHAQFNVPTCVAVDENGDVYITDMLNHRLRKITTANGRVHTVAGTGTPGSKDGPAREAQFDCPIGVAIGTGGDVIVVEASNRIRAFNPGHMGWRASVRTIAGTHAEFSSPSGVGMGADGSVLVCDVGNHRIVKIGAGSEAVHTVAGDDGSASATGEAHHARFHGIAVSPSGDIYVADNDNHRIRKIDAWSGVVSTVAGTKMLGWRDGEARTAQFHNPQGVAVAPDGCVFVADSGNNCIRKLDPINGHVVTVAGSGKKGSCDGEGGKAQFRGPGGLAIGHDGVLYVADGQNHCIRVIVKKTERELEDIEHELEQMVQQRGELAQDLTNATALTIAAAEDLERTKRAMSLASEQLAEMHNNLQERRLTLHAVVEERTAELQVVRSEVITMMSAKEQQVAALGSVEAALLDARAALGRMALEKAKCTQEVEYVNTHLKRVTEKNDTANDGTVVGEVYGNAFSVASSVEESSTREPKTDTEDDVSDEMASEPIKVAGVIMISERNRAKGDRQDFVGKHRKAQSGKEDKDVDDSLQFVDGTCQEAEPVFLEINLPSAVGLVPL